MSTRHTTSTGACTTVSATTRLPLACRPASYTLMLLGGSGGSEEVLLAGAAPAPPLPPPLTPAHREGRPWYMCIQLRLLRTCQPASAGLKVACVTGQGFRIAVEVKQQPAVAPAAQAAAPPLAAAVPTTPVLPWLTGPLACPLINVDLTSNPSEHGPRWPAVRALPVPAAPLMGALVPGCAAEGAARRQPTAARQQGRVGRPLQPHSNCKLNMVVVPLPLDAAAAEIGQCMYVLCKRFQLK